jgi:hypothetical protein
MYICVHIYMCVWKLRSCLQKLVEIRVETSQSKHEKEQNQNICPTGIKMHYKVIAAKKVWY